MFGLSSIWKKGGSSGEATLKSTQEIITDVIMSDVQQCQVDVRTVQIQTQQGGVNFAGGSSQKVVAQINMDCFASSDKSVELQNEIITKLTQKMETVGQQFSLSRSASEIHNDITNSVRSNISMESVQKCVASANAYQLQSQVGDYNIMRGQSQEVVFDAAAKCIAESAAVANVVAALSQDLDIDQKAETKNFAADVLGEIGDIMTGNLLIIVIAFLIFLWMFQGPLSGIIEEEGAETVRVARAAAVEGK